MNSQKEAFVSSTLLYVRTPHRHSRNEIRTENGTEEWDWCCGQPDNVDFKLLGIWRKWKSWSCGLEKLMNVVETALMSHSSRSSEGKSAERNTDRGSLAHKVWGRHKNFVRNLDRGYVTFWTGIRLYSACPGSWTNLNLQTIHWFAWQRIFQDQKASRLVLKKEISITAENLLQATGAVRKYSLQVGSLKQI